MLVRVSTGYNTYVMVARHKLNRKARNTRLRCDCGGYWFPHRRLGGLCYHRIDGWTAKKIDLPSGAPGPDCPF